MRGYEIRTQEQMEHQIKVAQALLNDLSNVNLWKELSRITGLQPVVVSKTRLTKTDYCPGLSVSTPSRCKICPLCLPRAQVPGQTSKWDYYLCRRYMSHEKLCPEIEDGEATRRLLEFIAFIQIQPDS